MLASGRRSTRSVSTRWSSHQREHPISEQSRRGLPGVLVLTRDALHLLVDFRYRDAVQMLQAIARGLSGSAGLGRARPAMTKRCSHCLARLASRRRRLRGRARARSRSTTGGGRTSQARSAGADVAGDRPSGRAGAAGEGRGGGGDAARGGATARGRGRGGVRAVRAGVSERACRGGARVGDARGRLRAARFRHDCRRRDRTRRCRTTAPAIGFWPPATSSCWTLAASWTDTAAT